MCVGVVSVVVVRTIVLIVIVVDETWHVIVVVVTVVMKYSRWKIFSSDTRRATRGRWLIVSRRTDLDIIGKVVDGDDVGSVGIGIVANVIVANPLFKPLRNTVRTHITQHATFANNVKDR